jgi:hypothetical protein
MPTIPAILRFFSFYAGFDVQVAIKMKEKNENPSVFDRGY